MYNKILGRDWTDLSLNTILNNQLASVQSSKLKICREKSSYEKLTQLRLNFKNSSNLASQAGL